MKSLRDADALIRKAYNNKSTEEPNFPTCAETQQLLNFCAVEPTESKIKTSRPYFLRICYHILMFVQQNAILHLHKQSHRRQ